VITNREEGKGKPPRLFPKTGYPLGYPEPALSRRLKREREIARKVKQSGLCLPVCFHFICWPNWPIKLYVYWL